MQVVWEEGSLLRRHRDEDSDQSHQPLPGTLMSKTTGNRGADWWPQALPLTCHRPMVETLNKGQAKEIKAHRFILYTPYVPWEPSEIRNSQKQGGLLTVHSVSSAGI